MRLFLRLLLLLLLSEEEEEEGDRSPSCVVYCLSLIHAEMCVLFCKYSNSYANGSTAAWRWWVGGDHFSVALNCPVASHPRPLMEVINAELPQCQQHFLINQTVKYWIVGPNYFSLIWILELPAVRFLLSGQRVYCSSICRRGEPQTHEILQTNGHLQSVHLHPLA